MTDEEIKMINNNQIEIYDEKIKEFIKQDTSQKVKECEELKKKLNTSEEWRIKAESLNEKQDLENTRYRKALEEIKEVIKSPCAEDCVYYEHSTCYDCIKTSILDIINKADFGKSERSETRSGESCVEPVEPPIIQEAKGEENEG